MQDKLRTRAFTLSKIPGAENPADILTKYVERPTLDHLLGKLNLDFEEGRPVSAPKITAYVAPISCLNTRRLPRGK